MPSKCRVHPVVFGIQVTPHHGNTALMCGDPPCVRVGRCVCVCGGGCLLCMYVGVIAQMGMFNSVQ